MNGMDRATGKPLSGAAHIAQSVADILTTPLGTRTMRRDYGSRLAELIDTPLTKNTALLWIAATAVALRRWEPRLRLTKVALSGLDAGGAPSLTITATRTDQPSGEPLTLAIPL